MFYEECQSRLEKCHDVSALYWEVRSLVPRFRGVSIENTSWTELSRSQVNKDIVRETLVVNGAVFQSGEDTHALKLFLLDKVGVCWELESRSTPSAGGIWLPWPSCAISSPSFRAPKAVWVKRLSVSHRATASRSSVISSLVPSP